MNLSKKKQLAKMALFLTALIWGSSFIIVKDTVNAVPPNLLLTIRFFIAFVILSTLYHKKYKLISKQYIKNGAWLGFILFISFLTQTIGISHTTPGKNAFLTTIYCVLVPFIAWGINRIKPDIYNTLAALLCFIGIGLVSLTQSLTISIGDLWTLTCGFFFALHMVYIDKLTKEHDVILLTIVQFGFTAFFSLLSTLLFEEIPTFSTIPVESLIGLLYLGCFCTAIGLLLQNIGQKYTSPSSSAIILTLESVFGVIFSVLLYGDTLTPRLLTGFLLIFTSVILSEVKPHFTLINKLNR